MIIGSLAVYWGLSYGKLLLTMSYCWLKVFYCETVSDYGLEEEARNYVNSIHVEGNDPIREYSYQEHHHQEEWDPVPEPEFEPEQPDSEAEAEALRLEEETTAFLQSIVISQKETEPSKEEPVVEPEKLTYASIVSVTHSRVRS